MSKLRKRYERIYQSLSRDELQQGMRQLDELALDDLFDYDTDLWLGFYTAEGVEVALERYGVLDDVRSRGFKRLELELRLDDPEEQMLRIYSKLPRCDEPLLELVVSRGVLHFQDELADRLGRAYATVLSVQWLLMQNPLATFEAERLPLPGQNRPGLGVGEQVMEILRNTCRRLKLGGLVTTPAHFHNAAMYGVTFRYIDPNAEGAFRALEREVLPQVGLSLPKASWAIHWNMVVDRADNPHEPFEWFHEPMICPIGEPFTSYFESSDFEDQVAEARKAHQFEVFRDALRRNMATRGLDPWDGARVDTWLDDSA